MDDAAFEAALFPPRASSSEPRPEPDWDGIHGQWRGQVDVVMRQNYRAGETVFVDYAGRSSRSSTGAAARRSR